MRSHHAPALTLLALTWSSAATAGSISTAGYMAGPDSGPASSDAAAIVYNPAALGGLDGYEVMLDGQINMIHIEVESTRNDGIDPNTGEAYKVAMADPMVPNLYAGIAGDVWKDRITAGVAFNIPYAGGGDYSQNESNPPPYTSHQRYFGINVVIARMAVTPALAITPIEGVHVGGSYGWYKDSISALQAGDSFGGEGLNPLDPSTGPYSADSLLEGSATGSGWAWNAGIFVDKFKYAQLGVAFSGATEFDAEGDGTVTIPAMLGKEESKQDAKVSFKQPMPAVLRAGLTSELNEKLTLGGVYEYQMWNKCCGEAEGDLVIGVTDANGDALKTPLGTDVATTQYSPRRLWDSSNMIAWGTYKLLDGKLTAGARVGYQQNAVPDTSASPTNLDFQSVGIMGSARYTFAEHYTVGLAFTRFVLFTREITDSAWGEYDKDSKNYVDDRFSPGEAGNVTSGPFKVSANGNYSGHDNVLGVRLAYKR